MYSVSHDQNKNIISINIQDVFDVEQAEKAYKEVETVLKKAKKGFTVLTDMSSLQEISLESFKSISKTMDLFNSCGIWRAIRIVPDSSKDIGFNIMNMFHYSPEVKIHIFESMEKAKEYMDLHKTQKA
jgi:hypothetical protein